MVLGAVGVVQSGATTRMSDLRMLASKTSRLACTTSAPNTARYAAEVRQVISVQAGDRSSTTAAAVSLWSRRGRCFVKVAGPWPASVGSDGLSSQKHEGDGTTPIGTFSIGPEFYGISQNPGVAYPYHRLVCGDWWDEDPSSPMYNRFVHLACGATPPFGGDSEALWKAVPQYDYFAVIDYNAAPIVRGRGSAIFIHVTVGTPTAGCIALGSGELLTLLGWLRPSLHPVVTIALSASLR